MRYKTKRSEPLNVGKVEIRSCKRQSVCACNSVSKREIEHVSLMTSTGSVLVGVAGQTSKLKQKHRISSLNLTSSYLFLPLHRSSLSYLPLCCV